ncbi:hypothetical protein [Halobacterium sp. KA-6]|uniref:hypothetical protein n=1 Tax=Halobacterium sp. KA-6 TaxID=2896368 RepID=UPI001E42B7B9|nr:hypothetical protein [Halobacterium sp. KA-6]MCD2202700.1 hypothetical protein [Halobacterium sp. KA-6]
MQPLQLARAVAALLGLAVLAAALFQGVLAALAEFGVPSWVASPTAVGAVLPPMLALADAYTPLGSHGRTAALRERPAIGLAADALLAAAVGGVVGYAGSQLLLSATAGRLVELVVVAGASLAGYATFVARNLDAYRSREPDVEEEMQP